MCIREIVNHGVNWLGKKPQAVWEMDISGTTLRVERSGSLCYWTGIKIMKCAEEVYNLSRNGEERTETFFGKPVRNYSGNRSCFIEYLASVVAKETGEKFRAEVDPKTEKQYHEFLRKILKL